jgi:hypothetical protein
MLKWFRKTPASDKDTDPAEAVKGDGKAVFLSYMDEEEMLDYIKNQELGWGKVIEKVRKTINGNSRKAD